MPRRSTGVRYVCLCWVTVIRVIPVSEAKGQPVVRRGDDLYRRSFGNAMDFPFQPVRIDCLMLPEITPGGAGRGTPRAGCPRCARRGMAIDLGLISMGGAVLVRIMNWPVRQGGL